MKILVAFGTRPEAIKCFPVIKALQANPDISVTTCATAQHRDILDQVMDLTDIKPDYDLGLMRAKPTLTDITVDVLQSMGRILEEVRPDRLLVQGDTTTTMAAAIAAFYQRIPVGHIEAGLRTNTIWSPWPEEANRRMVSVVTDMHFAPTAATRQNLLSENVDDEKIYVTGNTVIDALRLVKIRLDQGQLTQLIPPAVLNATRAAREQNKRLVLLTAHRRENWGNGIEQICQAVRLLAERGDLKIVYPVHPNPNVSSPVRKMLADHPDVVLLDPVNYASFISLLDNCVLVLTDSGGVQEEAPALGKPVLVLRDTTERPEAVAAGSARLIGCNADSIVSSSVKLLDDDDAYRAMSQVRNPFGDGNAATRIVDAIAAKGC